MHIWSSTEHSSDFSSIAWLNAIDQIILQDHLHTSWKLTGWRVLWHLLNCDDLGVFVQAIAIFVSQCISILVLDWEVLTAVCALVCLITAHLSEVSVIIVVADLSLFGGIAVVNRCLDHGLDETHACDNTTDRYQLVDQSRFEPAWSHVIAPKISLEVDVESLCFGGEGTVVSGSLLFLRISAFARIVRHLLNGTIKLTLEHADGIDRVPRHVVCEVRIRAPQIVDGN